MADFTASIAKFNAGVDLTLTAAGDTQTVDLSDVGDERVLIVQNNNGHRYYHHSRGNFLANALGDLSVDVADSGAIRLLAHWRARFKTTGSKITVGVAVTQSETYPM